MVDGVQHWVLLTVIQRALNENLDLDAALARVNQARATAASAGALVQNMRASWLCWHPVLISVEN